MNTLRAVAGRLMCWLGLHDDMVSLGYRGETLMQMDHHCRRCGRLATSWGDMT